MPLILEWPDIVLRLALTMAAGTIIGIDRSERGRPAGLRTTLLVCLAASVAMILANALMVTNGKAGDSFAVMDLMRLPLGILTGMGFIGAGAILRRGDRVVGITTAATLWAVTVIGLCFGAGKIGLGLGALALTAVVVSGLKWIELRLTVDRLAQLILQLTSEGPTASEVREILSLEGYRVVSWTMQWDEKGAAHHRKLRFNISSRRRLTEFKLPAFLEPLSKRPGVQRLRWKDLGRK